MHAGSGGGSGKTTIQDLTFDHYCDKASATILNYCLSGKHISEATLTLRKSGGDPLEYYIIKMKDVIITRAVNIMNYNMHIPRETISLAFSKVICDYTLQNSEGVKSGTITTGYDIKSNCVI